MRPEGVVLPASAIRQGLCLSHRGKQFGIEELVPEPAIERHGNTVLPRRSWLDVARAGAAAFGPASEGMGNELRACIAAIKRRCRVEPGELLQHGY